MVTKHGFPPHDIGDFRTFLQQQWSQHLQELDSTPRLRVDHISRLKAALGEQVVIHHADHQNQNARIFCPQLYFQMCNNMDRPPTIFQVECDTRRGSNKGAETGKTMDSNTIQMGHQLGR